ncbi:MAG: hypothetical protein JNN08_09215 [Bryobacterales bacterium]|nr:hypothetical protein [Bryobacterales bacterium]
MAKVDEWRRRVDDWKAVLKQPKNAGLKATGISEAIRKVGDAEMDFAKAKEPGKAIVKGLTDLLKALDDLINLCKKTSDKHKTVFTTACQHLDGVRAAAVARRTEAAREVDQARQAVGQRCEEASQQLRAARTIQELAAAWREFVTEFETQGKGYPTLKAQINTAKGHRAPDPNGSLEQERTVFLRLAQACQRATAVR